MSSHPQPNELQLDDASAVILLDIPIGEGKRSQKKYKLYRGLIERLSPSFFSSIVEPLQADHDSPSNASSSLAAKHYAVKKELEILEDELDVLQAYLLHDTDIYTAPFQTLLAIFVVTSSGKCNFPSTHNAASKRLEELVFQEPDLLSLRTDLLDGGLIRDERQAIANLEKTLGVVEGSEKNSKLSKPLRNLLYYTYTIIDDSESTETTQLKNEKAIDPVQAGSTSESHLRDRETRITHVLTEKLSDAISPALFTPPAAQHMPCTNAIANLWSSHAVLPVLTPAAEWSTSSVDARSSGRRPRTRGMADVFGMLGAWVEETWIGDESASSEIGQGPCEECLEFLREEWRSEARAIWGKMDQWIEEAEGQSEDNTAGKLEKSDPTPS